MNIKVSKQLGWFFIILSILFQIIGGIMDVMEKEKIYISKQHIFADALFMLVLGFGILLIQKS